MGEGWMGVMLPQYNHRNEGHQIRECFFFH
jgi:hypothetical protein